MSTLPIHAPSIRTCATKFPPSSATAMFIGCPISLAFFSAATITLRSSSKPTMGIRSFAMGNGLSGPESHGLYTLRRRHWAGGASRCKVKTSTRDLIGAIVKLTDLRGILQYVPQFREKTFIIAVDGGIVTDENFANILVDIALLRSLNIRVAVVHGAAEQIAALADRQNVQPSD